MFNDYEVIPDKVRTIDLENGNKLNMTRHDPYGFIRLSLDRGSLPDSMKDIQYTDWDFAYIAAQKYITQRKLLVEEIKDKKAI